MSCRDYRREFSNALKWCCSSSVIHILIHTLSTVQCRNPCLRALRAQGNSLHAESYSSLILVFVQVSSLQLIILPLLIPISVSYIFCLEIKEQEMLLQDYFCIFSLHNTTCVQLRSCGKHSRGHGRPQPQASKARL